ncbi:MAG TPA: DMT family transporter [Actinomycetales bacterium]|jgi:drug/metabolite transporter (DMT)-like permease|nr:DMT family transporter [Actinomycetales bacterium]
MALTGSEPVAVVAALAAAASFGAAGVLQHKATQQAPAQEPLHFHLLVDLFQIRAFRWGVLLSGVGFGLQVVALRFGPLILVQPLLVTGLLFYLGFASLLEHRRPDAIILVGAVTALVGLSVFLTVASPSAGAGSFESAAALPLGISLVAVVAVCLLVASRLRSELRALPLAAATAVCYGVTAGLVRSLLSSIEGAHVLTNWQLYAALVTGPAGFLLNQNAFQTGVLGSVATATITVGDPLVSIGIGIVWLGESISTEPLDVVGEVLSLGLLAGGVTILAGRAQVVAERIKAGARAPGAT